MDRFDCRFCSGNPFASLFGFGSINKPGSGNVKSKASDSPSVSSTCPSTARESRRDTATFERRSLEDQKLLINSWDQYVHPRAREFFPSAEMLQSVLLQLAKSLTKDEDAILGDDKCVYWYGEVTKTEPQQAAIRMVKPGESIESVTFVNRVLVFVFATDESFEQLMKLPKAPFKMTCGDQLCVNLNHISMEC